MSDALHEHAGVSAAQLEELLHLVAASDVTELDVTLGSTHLSLKRPAHTAVVPESYVAQESLEPTSLAITSPLVGMFRASVSVGAMVEPGQPIGAIEALGMPTSVDAPDSGTVEELLVQDGTPVEYGQPLLILRRTLGSRAP